MFIFNHALKDCIDSIEIILTQLVDVNLLINSLINICDEPISEW